MDNYFVTLKIINGKLKIFYTNKLSGIVTSIAIKPVKKDIFEMSAHNF